MRKLSHHELDKLINGLRLLSPDLRNRVAPLVHHCRALEQEIKELNNRIERLTQPDMFSQDKLSERLYLWFRAKKEKIIQNYCQVHKKSRLEALDIANSYARSAGYPEVKGD